MKSLFKLILLFFSISLVHAQDRVDNYPPLTNIRIQGPPNSSTAILNDIYVTGSAGTGVKGYVVNENDDTFISQNEQMIELLSLLAYSSGEGIPQELELSEKNLSITGGNTVTLPTWGNTDDTISSDRVINQGDKSFSIKGKNFGLHLNAKLSDLDSLMNLIIQNGSGADDTIVISAFSKRNEIFKDFNFNGLVENFNGKSTDPILAKFKGNPFPLEDPTKVGSFNILSVTNDVEAIPGDTLIYTQIQSIYKDIPNGKFYSSGIEAIGGRISIYSNNALINKAVRISFENDKISIKSLSNDVVTSELEFDNNGVSIHGSISYTSIENYTPGGDDTISNNVRTYIYNPDTLQNNITIHLPDAPVDGQYLTIVGGGTIQYGNVATNIDLLDHNGSSPIGWTNNDLQAGPGGTFVWVESANRWYQITY